MDYKFILKILFSLILILAVTMPAFGQQISGSSTTMPYYWSDSVMGKDYSYLALYQFTQVGAYDVGVPGMDFVFSGWGRLDSLESYDHENEAAGDGELQTVYFRWRQEEDIFDVTLGRSFIYMGPVLERIDGISTKIEVFPGIGVEAFGGIPVVSDVGDREDDYGFGTRVFAGYGRYFNFGISGASFMEKSDPDRRRLGGDLTLCPVYWFQLFGHGYYDQLYNALYDASGTMIFRPVGDLKLLGQFEHVMPSAFLGMGSIFSVFSYDKISRINSQVSYVIKRRVSLLGEYNHYIYDSTDPANRYGGAIGVLWGERRADTFNIGLYNLDREDNGYLELRGYFMQSLGSKLFCTLDAVGYKLDEKLYGVDQGFYSTGSLGWHIIEALDLQISGFYGFSPFYEEDFRGLLKLSHNFDFRFGESEMVR